MVDLNRENHTWVLSRFSFEIDYLPKAHDKVSIRTWINDYSRLISTRCFTVADANGEIIGGACSQWCMLDLQARKAIDLSKLHNDYTQYVLREYETPIAKPRKILPLTPTSSHTHRASYSDIDFNGHVNSLRYIELMLNMLPLKIIEQSAPMRIDLQYIAECYHGEELTINYEQRGNTSMLEILKGENTPAVRCAIEWRR